MTWLNCTFGATLLWGFYSILAAKAGRVHGGNINALFAGICSVAITLIVLALSKRGSEEIRKVSPESFWTALVMGSMYGCAFLLFMRGVEQKPEKLSLMCVITGAAPVITVLANHMLGYGEKLSPQQWIAVALVPVMVLLANWK